MSSLFPTGRPCRQLFSSARQLVRYYCSTGVETQQSSDEQPSLAPDESDYAYNNVEKKKNKIKPTHTVEEQIAYMKSQAFKNAYQGLPVYKWYRRNLHVQAILQPPPRLRCIDNENRIRMNNACPICRDEYLFFDYRNPDLIKQFLAPGTDQPIDILKSGLCREQYANLQAQLLKAREHGLIEFCVEFRVFDYSQWYPDWKSDEFDEEETKQITRRSARFEMPLERQNVMFPEHSKDSASRFDMFWKRHDKFARKAK